MMATMQDRRDKKELILDFITEYRRVHGVSPVVREIRDVLGLSSTSVVHYNVGKLIEEGKLRRAGVPTERASGARNLVPVEQPNSMKAELFDLLAGERDS